MYWTCGWHINSDLCRLAAQTSGHTSAICHSSIKDRPGPLKLEARTFQVELYRRAKIQNTIAVLDTGVFHPYFVLTTSTNGVLVRKDIHSSNANRRYSEVRD